MPPTLAILGIRHHGPGSARSLVRALDEFKPRALLVEGPPDADHLIPLAAHNDTRPPAAILVYEPDAPRHAAYYPFAEFSPEWQAIRWALRHKIPVRFMDLPQANRKAHVDEPEVPEDEDSPPETDSRPEPEEVASDPLDHLARAAGFSDGERWWEHMVEHRRAGAMDTFAAIAEAMAALRADLPPRDDPDEPLREAYMRRTIRAAIKEGHDRIAVVCGAWHAPQLTEATLRERPAKQDDALLKDLPRRKISATWIPWTHSRLTFASGYGAGVRSPGWYEHLWIHHADVTEQWMTRVARSLRAHDLDASPAHIIESVRLADTLAALRGHHLAGLDELNEATLSVVCNGNPMPMRLLTRELIVGEKLGEVPEDVPSVPLQRDLARLQTSLRLKPSADDRLLDLDQRNATDLERSRLLHRLSILGIPWGDLQEDQRRRTSTFHEIWKLQWKPEFAVAVIEAAQWGNTVAEAAARCVIERAAAATDLPSLTGMLDHVLLADLPDAARALIARIQVVSAIGADLGALMDGLPSMAAVLRYGNVRKADLALVEPVVAGLLARIGAGLLPACVSLDDEAADQMARRLAAINAALLTIERADQLTYWRERLRALGEAAGIHGLVSGRCWRILLDASAAEPEEIARRFSHALSRAQDPAAASAWLEGFLSGSGLILLHDDRLFALIDGWISELSADAFEQVLPIVRRTFSTFAAGERRQIGERARRAGGPAAPAPAAADGYNARRGDLVLPILQLILGEEAAR